MPLRFRLLLALLVVNLGVLVVAEVVTSRLQERRFRESVARTPALLSEGILYSVYAPGRMPGDERVRRLLATHVSLLRQYFEDVLITNGLPEADFRGSVQINPMGAVQRDPEQFPYAAIRDGIARAVREVAVVEAGGGLCVPIRSGREIVAGAWVRPRSDLLPAPLPPYAFLVPVLVATFVLGGFSFVLIGRGVLGPIERLSKAAARVAHGDHSVRVAAVRGAPELNVFVDAFNGMAEQIGRHQDELQQEVERATDEARRRERALIASGRLAAVGTLAAGIAHEINNPIGGMLNAVRRLRERAELSDRDLVYLDLVADGLERIARTTRRVLDFSPRSIEARPFRVADAVEGARALVDHRFRHGAGVRFQAELPSDLPDLVGDRHEFQQVLLNLFLNSLDVLEGRGGRIDVSARETGDGVEILVEDDGPGMATEDVARVFDPFFSAKGRPDASGLGMFISHAIVSNHGGSIEVDSSPGAGVPGLAADAGRGERWAGDRVVTDAHRAEHRPVRSRSSVRCAR